MTKKTTDNPTAANTPNERAVETTQERREVNKSGFYCYIGPNLKGLLQTGTFFRGTREEAYASAAKAIEAHPEVKSLIISGDALPAARIRVKTPGNILYVNFNKLAGKGGK